MKIGKKIDNSNLRKESENEKVPILELLFQKLSSEKNVKRTLLAICPNSELVLKAAIRSAKRNNAPILFAATLNQVDIDRGYTGWTHEDLVRKIKQESYSINFTGPIIICIDHGGPWAKDRQVIEGWDLKKSMDWIKKSFEAAIKAGFDMIHVDPTIDKVNKINIETVVERTVGLISYCQDFINTNGFASVSYEVGTEEVHGGLVNMDVFENFLKLLKKGLKKAGLEDIWPKFIVAKVGTDLHTSIFDTRIAEDVVERVKPYGSYIKGHYTDFVSNPSDYPQSGMGGANVGPEFTIIEYDIMDRLCKIEDSLQGEGCVALKSNFMNLIEKAVVASGRWKKWLGEDEKDLDSIKSERKDWIIKTGARYVWSEPQIECSRSILFKNLALNGIDGETIVLSEIERVIDKYYREFNLLNLNAIHNLG